MEFPVGLIAAAVASWASLNLLPRATSQLRTNKFATLALNFASQSIISGVDVARHALRKQLQLRPGFVSYQSHLPPGAARTTFCALSSLLPGTLPTGNDEDGTLLVHCLDVEQPVTTNLAAEEALFMRMLGHD